VYGNPSLSLHPTIYAARKLILYAHLGKDVETEEEPTASFLGSEQRPPSPEPLAKITANIDPVDATDSKTTALHSSPLPISSSTSALYFGPPHAEKDAAAYRSHSLWEMPSLVRPSRPSASSRSSNASSRGSSLSGFPALGISPYKHEYSAQWYEMTENSRCSEGDESIADFSIPADHGPVGGGGRGVGNLLHTDEADSYDFLPPNAVSTPLGTSPRPVQSASGGAPRTSFLGAFRRSADRSAVAGQLTSHPRLPDSFFQPAKEAADSCEDGPGLSGAGLDEDITSASDMMAAQSRADQGPTFPAENGQSGLFMYIDIHGHASKRGIFMYGNHFPNPETKISSLLFPKLMSINCANFDFPACNFTEESQIFKISLKLTGTGKCKFKQKRD
jgi:hypothetical protein